MEREKQKSLKEINKSLQENIRMLPEEYLRQMQPSAEDLDRVTAEHEQMIKALRPLFIAMFVLIVLFGSLFGSFAYYSVQLERSIDDKNEIIRRYQYQDSIFSRLLDQTDTSKYISYRICNGVPVTYHQLACKYDSLQTKYNELLMENAHNQDVLELIQQLYPYEVTERDGNIRVTGLNYRSQISSANAKIDSLDRLNKKTYNKYDIEKLKLELILKNYPITLKQDSTRIILEAPKLDSAMMLLPYYRDKLTYDSITRTWSIVYTRKEVVVTESKKSKKKK